MCMQVPNMSIFSPASRSCLTCLIIYNLTKHSPNKNEIPPPPRTSNVARRSLLHSSFAAQRAAEAHHFLPSVAGRAVACNPCNLGTRVNRDTVALAFKIGTEMQFSPRRMPLCPNQIKPMRRLIRTKGNAFHKYYRRADCVIVPLLKRHRRLQNNISF